MSSTPLVSLLSLGLMKVFRTPFSKGYTAGHRFGTGPFTLLGAPQNLGELHEF